MALCKYGWHCSRPDCFYSHPDGRQIDMDAQVTSSNAQPEPVPCRFGYACTRPNCKYLHAQDPAASAPQQLRATAPVSTRSTVDLLKDASKQNRQPNATACRYGASCSKPSCTFVHPPGHVTLTPGKVPATMQTMRQPIPEPPPQPAAAASSSHAPPCKFGRNCTRQDCTFAHPNGRVSDQRGQHVAASARLQEGMGEEESAAWDHAAPHGADGEYDGEYDDENGGEYDSEYDSEYEEMGRGKAAAQHDRAPFGAGEDYEDYDEDEDASQAAVAPIGGCFAKPCIYGSSCTRPSCWYQHPGDLDAGGGQDGRGGEDAARLVDFDDDVRAASGVVLKQDIPDVGPALAMALRQTFGRKLAGLAVLLGCAVEIVESQQLLCLTAAPDVMDAAAAAAKAELAQLRSELADEVAEVPVVGATRAVIGAGCAVKEILVAGEYVTLAVTAPGAAVSGDEVSRLAGMHGTVRSVAAVDVAGSRTLRVMMHSSEQAGRAAAALNGRRMADGSVLSVTGHCPPPATATFTASHSVKVTWTRGKPSGVAYVQFATAAEAKHALARVTVRVTAKKQRPGRAPRGAVDAARVGGTFMFCGISERCDRTLQVKLPGSGRCKSGLLAMEPQQLKAAFQQYGTVQEVTTMRGAATDKKGRVRPEPPGLQEELTAQVMSLLTHCGAVESVQLLPFKHKTQSGCAIVRYRNHAGSEQAVRELDGKVLEPDCTLSVVFDAACRLVLDGRIHRAVQGRLALAMEYVAHRWPQVSVKVKEQSSPDAAAAAAPQGRAAAPGTASSSRVIIKLGGADKDAMVQAKRELEKAVAGKVLATDRPEDLLALLTPQGKAFMLQVEATHNERTNAARAGHAVHLRWDRAQRAVRIFSSSDEVVAAVEDEVRRHLQALGAANEVVVERALPLDPAAFTWFVKQGEEPLSELARGSRVEGARLDMPRRALVLRGSAAAVRAAMEAVPKLLTAASLGLSPVAGASGVADASDAPPCPVCFCPAEQPYSLLACRHSYCTDCIQSMLRAAAGSPAMCCAAGCTAPVALRDFEQLLPPAQQQDSHRAALRSYVQLAPERWGWCLTPDCPQVYRRGCPELACDVCLGHWCTECKVPWHQGLSCAVYQQRKRGDSEFERWKATHTKPCPRCKAPIEKNDGCNHMTCSNCHSHFCWLCTECFEDAKKTYDHLTLKHGGIFNYD